MSRTIRWGAAVLVLACLTAGTAQAGPLTRIRPDFAAPEVGSRLEAAWNRLVSLVRPVEPKPDQTLSPSPEKSSCSSDPLGHPVNCS